MDYNYCTISSKSRLYQCLALFGSLVELLDNVKLYVLCMDGETYSILNALKCEELIPVMLEDIEDEAVLELKEKRSLSEYCWTMKPVFIESILKNCTDIIRITYLDADIFFFSSPKPIHTGCFGKSVWLTPHNYNEQIKYVEKEVGKYNSGFISFKKNKHGLECLDWWKKRCLEWCYNTTVGGGFGDQKYLDEMSEFFYGVTEISIPGVNIAPWNDEGAVFNEKNGKVFINGHKLICYHFCGFKVLGKSEFIVQFGNKYNHVIHRPYMEALRNVIIDVESIDPGFEGYYRMNPDEERYNVFSI